MRQRSPRLVAFLFVVSGFTALVYQVVLSRYVQLIVGGTAYAVSALLVAFMLGMSLGSALGGRWADRTTHPLRLYALAEGAIGVYCAGFPLVFPLLQDLYLSLAPPLEGPPGPRTLVRFLVGGAAFLLPSFFMGLTTPAFVRAVTVGRSDRGRRLAHLYSLNVFGAAVGALGTAYVLVPQIGMLGSLALGSVLNLVVCFTAWRLSRPIPVARPASDGARPAVAVPWDARIAGFLVAALASGFLSFALEIVWTHLLAVLLGNSVYAFGLMLGALLLGLAAGARLAHGVSGPEGRAATTIGAAQVAAGLAVILTLGVWDRVPQVFLALARSSPSFALLEAVRFAVAFVLMLGPTALLGMAFPLALRGVGAQAGALGQRVGLVYGVNTLGAVAGAIAAPYLLLPRLGSLTSLRVLGVLLMLSGAVALLWLSPSRGKRVMAGLAVAAAAFGALRPVQWDFGALNVAAAIYLGRSTSQGGRIVFQREDPTGGLTTVVESREVKTLLTNGKFQGDDSEEVPIQHRLANIPTLFTPGRERALVVGLGTGVTLASLAAHGFARTVCAELSEPIVEAAEQQFAKVNGGVLRSPSVELVRDDGRSVLLERDDLYDVVSVEATTIWFAGVGTLYSEEFYRLVSRRLRRQGVLLQWFPMHHLSARNLYLVVNTARAAFPYVSVWTHRHQGFVVASNEPLSVDLASVRSDVARPAMQPYLRELVSGSPLELLADLAVTDTDQDRFLDAMAELLLTKRSVVATDTWPVLEYEAPKDILSNFSYFQNRATLRRFRSTRPFPFRGTPTPQEAGLAEAAFSHGWNDPTALARLAGVWERVPELSAAMSRFVLDELTGEDVAGAATDPVGTFRGGAPALARMMAQAGGSMRCESAIGQAASAPRVPLTVAGSVGLSLEPTGPEAALDGFASPDFAEGWRVRPDGLPPRLDLAFDRPRRVSSIALVALPVDGSLLRVRLFGRDASGRFKPLAGGGDVADLRCRGARTYTLDPEEGALTAIRIELQGEALSHRLAVHEVWAVEAAAR